MALRLYNTLTRTKEEFAPIDPSNVRMYVCGPTVYDYAHIGNARPVIVFDVLFRLLRHLYGEKHVTYVRNITDIDDKINARAREEGTTIRELTERTAKQFHEDISALGVLPPTHEPRATDHVAGMIAMIERLIAQGHAYVAEGHVLFDVPSMPEYGKLSRRPLDDMIAGARVDVAPYKKGDMDFVLWKPSDDQTPGWESPWGRGRPGWHIECSAMSKYHLGEVFDIHGGGIDLIFPHHENELAQTRCAFGHDVMANIWMHNGFLQVEGQKMAKSAGNFVTIRDLLKDWPGDVLRLQMLSSHYRVPIDWTETKSELAKRELEEWSYALQDYFAWPEVAPHPDLIDALRDDLSTSEALAVLRGLFSKAKRGSSSERQVFASSCKFMGFRDLNNPGNFEHTVAAKNLNDVDIEQYSLLINRFRAASSNANFGTATSNYKMPEYIPGTDIKLMVAKGGFITLAHKDEDFEKRVEKLVSDRQLARASKNWAESDRIRDELAAMGIAIKDNKDGTTSWEVKR